MTSLSVPMKGRTRHKVRLSRALDNMIDEKFGLSRVLGSNLIKNPTLSRALNGMYD